MHQPKRLEDSIVNDRLLKPKTILAKELDSKVSKLPMLNLSFDPH
ncbi:unnamed protein product [Acidithrix sp. C25]|nr:unnamed protein product [Acidithrix sp. C25]